jgi:hypothetical protein
MKKMFLVMIVFLISATTIWAGAAGGNHQILRWHVNQLKLQRVQLGQFSQR